MLPSTQVATNPYLRELILDHLAPNWRTSSHKTQVDDLQVLLTVNNAFFEDGAKRLYGNVSVMRGTPPVEPSLFWCPRWWKTDCDRREWYKALMCSIDIIGCYFDIQDFQAAVWTAIFPRTTRLVITVILEHPEVPDLKEMTWCIARDTATDDFKRLELNVEYFNEIGDGEDHGEVAAELRKYKGPHLDLITLKGTDFICKSFIPSLFESPFPKITCTTLQHLMIAQAPFTSSAILELVEQLPELRTLWFVLESNMSDDEFDTLTSHCPHLRELEIIDYGPCGWHLSLEDALYTITANCPHVTDLCVPFERRAELYTARSPLPEEFEMPFDHEAEFQDLGCIQRLRLAIVPRFRYDAPSKPDAWWYHEDPSKNDPVSDPDQINELFYRLFGLETAERGGCKIEVFYPKEEDVYELLHQGDLPESEEAFAQDVQEVRDGLVRRWAAGEKMRRRHRELVVVDGLLRLDGVS